MSTPGLLGSVALVREFVTSGNAVFTLVSKNTGTRYTYKMKKPKRNTVYHVSVLTRPDHFVYFGTVVDAGRFIFNPARATIQCHEERVKAFEWFWRQISEENDSMLDTLEVWHEGACGRCGRRLTVPDSIERGLGPTCYTVNNNTFKMEEIDK